MKDTRIAVELSKTINLGNYESCKVQAGISFDLTDAESIEEGFRNAWAFVDDQLKERLKEEEGEGHGPRLRQRRRDRQAGPGY